MTTHAAPVLFDPAPSETPWSSLESTVSRLDLAELRKAYAEKDQLLLLDTLFSPSELGVLKNAAERLRPNVVRKRLPGYKKSGSVNYEDARRVAPELELLYRNPKLTAALSTVAGVELLPCPDRDLHACALYYYTEPGDYIGHHYDSSHYKGARYTVLVGIVNDTAQSRLSCTLWTKEKDREHVALEVSTDPGTFVFFNGDRLWHCVTPIAKNEERIVLTLEYVTDPRMNPIRRMVSDFKDAATYFGFARKKK